MKTNKPNNGNIKNNTDSFLEALRGLSSAAVDSAKNDLVKKGVSDIFDSLSPFSNKQDHATGPQSQRPENNYQPENKRPFQIRQLENIRHEEKILFTREQRETRQQVASLQEEIKKLAKTTSDLSSQAKEAEITAMQETPMAGTYHISFFMKLREVLAKIRSNLQESSLWLASWNKKAQKKNAYWNGFKKSGSKFLLSSDRTVATQAG